MQKRETSEDFRRKAEEAERLAKEAQDELARESWRDIARHWRNWQSRSNTADQMQQWFKNAAPTDKGCCNGASSGYSDKSARPRKPDTSSRDMTLSSLQGLDWQLWA